MIKRQGILISFILLLLLISFFSDRFLTSRNVILVLTQVSIMGVMACGLTYLLIGRNFDLSIGSQLSLTTVLVVDLHDKIGPVGAICIALLAGIIIGSINGYLIGFQKLNSLIVTLGMLPVVQALTLIYSKGMYSTIAKPEETAFAFIGRGSLLGIPVPIIIFAVVALVLGIVLAKTTYGRRLYAVGGNPTASWFAGIREHWIVFSTFVLTGLTAAIAGVMMGSRVMAAQNYLGLNYELDVLTAVILGGTSLYGGTGSITKTVIGVLILGFLKNGFILMGLPYYTQMIAQWVIIVGAVWLDVITKKERS
jgi:ribose transport system permease protein